MRGVVLADAGPLYAATDPDDSLHELYLREKGRLATDNLRTVIPYSTLQEAHGLVLRSLGSAQARVFLSDLVQTAVFLTPTSEDYDGATARVLRYPDQDISLADAVLAEVSERLDAPVWTYDHHFDVMGANVWRP